MEEVVLGFMLTAAAMLFGTMLGLLVRYGSWRAAILGGFAGAVMAIMLITTTGIDVADHEEPASTGDATLSGKTVVILPSPTEERRLR